MPADFAAQTWLPLLRDLLLKSLPLFALAGLAALLLRRASASARHLVWLLLLGSLLLLPLCSLVLPRWSVPVPSVHRSQPVAALPPPASPVSAPPSAPLSPEPPANSAPTPAFSPIPAPLAAPTRPAAAPIAWPRRLLLLWIVGLALVAAPVLAGLIRLHSLRRQCAFIANGPIAELAPGLAREIGVLRPVLLLHGSEDAAQMPMTWGWARPVILLPDDASDWPADRLRAVLLHELAHIRRGDWPCQMLAHFVCALYWFHPLVWLAARQMRLESERACDDLVLTAGVAPSDYARHLLEIVRAFKNVNLSVPVALPMAQPTQIEGRLRAILQRDAKRGGMTRRSLAAALIAAAGLLIPLAALRPVAQAAAALPRAGQSAQADKAPLHPEIAVAQLKRIYGFLAVYRHRHGNAYPPGDLDLVLDVKAHPQAYGLPKRDAAENTRQVARCFTNDDTRQSELLRSFYAWSHRKTPMIGSIYYIQNRRLDGTLVGSAKPAGTRDLLAWTDLYVHGNPARGFYLTLWDDGRVERVPYDQILYAPRSLLKSRRAMTKAALKNYVCKPNAGGLLMAFPGQAGLPSNTLTHQEFNDAIGVPRPKAATGETR